MIALAVAGSIMMASKVRKEQLTAYGADVNADVEGAYALQYRTGLWTKHPQNRLAIGAMAAWRA